MHIHTPPTRRMSTVHTCNLRKRFSVGILAMDDDELIEGEEEGHVDFSVIGNAGFES
jgi:hypothetical protein